jgi:hypothetical protein
MELDELIMLGACSLLSRKFELRSSGIPAPVEINTAVQTAHKVWRATLDKNNDPCES